MVRCLLVFCALWITHLAIANDGAYYISGNQLIPINETDITLKKEILTIKKINNLFIEVTVYYELFNPKDDKKLTVGFEAFSPSGDVNGTPKNGGHPYMRDFTVDMNNSILPYSIAYVTDSAYAKNGNIKSQKLEEIKKGIDDANFVDFFYVYHFTANFKKGLNIIIHTYNYNISNSVYYQYNFEYILTAANRWGNKQIDDFTLIMDMGDFENFDVMKRFFTKSADWLINGIGKVKTVHHDETAYPAGEALEFFVQKGNLIFQKKNFHPAGELLVYSKRFYAANIDELPFSYYQQEQIPEPKNDFERKLLKNLPFARRGYIFQAAELKNYFEKMSWYIPNPNYNPDIESLTETEKKWVEKWK